MPDPANSAPPSHRLLLQGLIALWASEAVLARISSDQQPLDDLAVSALGLGLLSLPALLLATRAPGRLRDVLLAVAAALAPTLVVVGIVAPNLSGGSPTRRALMVAVVAGLALTGVGLARAWRQRPLPSGPAFTVALVAAAALGSWALANSLPAPLVLLTLAAAFVAVALSARRPRLLPLSALLAVAIARWPVALPTATWVDRPAAAVGAPDIVLITIDTLRADTGQQMAVYQRLAAQGLAFPDVQTAAPWTLPSFGTVHTGQPIDRHGAGTTDEGEHNGLDADVATLAQRLAAAGYDTAAIVGRNPWLAPAFGFSAGFDLYDHTDALSAHALPRGPSAGSTARPFITRVLMKAGLGGRRHLRSADELVDRALAVVDQRRRDRPLFLWLHFLDCHIPYRHATEFDLPWRAAVDLDGGSWTLDRIDGLADDPYWPTPEGRAVFLSAYTQEVGIIDRELGRLLDRLDGRSRPSVVALTSDHGEEFFEHGAHGHGHAFPQEVIAVPLVIAGLPGVPAGTQEPALVHHLDLAPTLLAAAGLSTADLPGVVLRGSLALDSVLPAPDPARVNATENLIDARYGLGGIALRQGAWKAILPATGPPSLFNLDDDPYEQSDLAATNPDRLAALQSAAPPAAHLHGPAVAVDPQTADMLRSLGYVEE